MEKHNFVEDDIIAEKSLKGEFDEHLADTREIKFLPEKDKKEVVFKETKEPETLKDIPCFFESSRIKDSPTFKEQLKQLVIRWIKYMRREGRDLYWKNIDEKSAIPKLMEIFNLTEEDVGKSKISKVEGFL